MFYTGTFYKGVQKLLRSCASQRLSGVTGGVGGWLVAPGVLPVDAVRGMAAAGIGGGRGGAPVRGVGPIPVGGRGRRVRVARPFASASESGESDC